MTAIRRAEPRRLRRGPTRRRSGTPEDKLTKAELGHLKKAGAPAMRTLVEFRDAEIPAGIG